MYTSKPPLYESFNLVHYRPNLDRLLQMVNNEQVKEEDERRLTEYRWSEIHIHKKNMADRGAFIQLLFLLKDMWVAHPGLIKTARHQIDVTSNDKLTVHRAVYGPGPTAKQHAERRYKGYAKKSLSRVLTQNGPATSSLLLKYWYFKVLCWLSQTERGDSQVLVPSTKHGRVYRFCW